MSFGAHVNILFTINFKILSLNKFVQILLIIECRMVDEFWASSPISFKHMFFWCQFLDPHLITYNLIVGVSLKWVTKLGMLTLLQFNTKFCNLTGTTSSSSKRIFIHSWWASISWWHLMCRVERPWTRCLRNWKQRILNTPKKRLTHFLVLPSGDLEGFFQMLEW